MPGTACPNFVSGNRVGKRAMPRTVTTFGQVLPGLAAGIAEAAEIAFRDQANAEKSSIFSMQ
jgi:hypothetical protein